jgi:TonB family protein
MKFNSLKFSFIAAVLSFSIAACNNDSTNSSTTEPKKDSNTSETNPSTTQTPAKKKGRASISVTANAEAGVKMEKDKMGYYNYTEILPAYNGGQAALESYINDNIEYPQEAIDNNVEGTVNVQFAVDEQGNVSNVRTIGNKVGYGLEEEAVKVVAAMPKWTPGMVKGKNVKTWRTLPIVYRLES